MVRRPGALLAVPLVLLAIPSAASAVGMTDSYPREVAVTSTGEGVRLTQFQARVRRAGDRLRVTVRLAGASVADTRRLRITVARCTVTSKHYKYDYEAPDAPSRPTCKPDARGTREVTVTTAPFSLTRTFTIARPAKEPGALRVRIRVPKGSPNTGPPCKGYREICGVDDTGDLLLNGNTWRYKSGTWWGITATPPAGVTLDRIVFRSRSGGWVTTSAAPAKVVTTWGYAGEAPAKTKSMSLLAGVQRVLRMNSTFGGEFQTRTTVRVLDYAAAIGAQRLFTVELPLPVWTSRYPTR